MSLGLYADIRLEDLLEILQTSKQEKVSLCFGKAVVTIAMPKDVAKDLYKKCEDKMD